MATTSKGKRRPKTATAKPFKPHNRDDDVNFKLKFRSDVRELGGDDEDIQLLQDVDDSQEVLDIAAAQDGDDGDVDMKSLKSLIKSLGFDKVKPTAEGSEDEAGDDEKVDSDADESDEEIPKEKSNKSKLKSSETKSAKDRTSNLEDKSRTISKSDRTSSESPKQSNVIQHAEVSSTTPTPASSEDDSEGGDEDNDERKLLKGYVARKYLLISLKEGDKWYESEYSKNPSPDFRPVKASVVSEYHKLAARLHQDEVAQHASTSTGDASSKAEWMRKVVASGVLSDKIAALTLQTQKSPLHNMHSLDIVLNMVRKKGRREALLALNEVKQLFMEELLPDNRKLKLFSQHPFLDLDKMSRGKSRDERDKRLLCWYFEAQLKLKYEAFVASLETMCHDNVSAVKQKAVAVMEELLAAKPEQEKVLLSQLVNKIGDPDNKVASKAVYLLQKLVESQSAMKTVVVKEVEKVLYRVNIRQKAQYYAMCFLNQIILTHDDAELASKLIIMYFSFFKACTKKKDIDQKMLSAVLTGVNRAYPYAKVDDSKMEAEVNTLFTVVHKSPFNIGVQSLLLLKQVLGERYSISDRFYSALYKKLLDPTLENSPRQPMFLNLLYQTLKADVQVKRNKAFVKRILQVCESQQPSFICGALFLISELMRLKPGLKTVMHVVEGDDEEEHFVDIPVDSDDEEEHFVDLPMENDEDNDDDDKGNKDAKTVVETKEEDSSTKQSTSKPSVSSWVHHKLAKEASDVKVTYDPLGRNPLYCGAESSALWELQKLTKHYHPSVIVFAETLLRGDTITYTGNPLQDFTLMKFLERFVYKNPKQTDTAEKVSVLQPQTKKYMPSALRQMAVNSKKFIDTPEDQIPIDELFFHRFFQQQGKHLAQTKKNKEEAGSDEDEVDDDADSLGSDVEIDSDVSDEEFDRILDEMEKRGEDEDIMDFAGEFSRKKSTKRSDGSDDDEDDDEVESDSDDENYLNPDLDDDSDMSGAEENGFKMEGANDFDEEAFGASDSDNDDFAPTPKQKFKAKTKPDRQAVDVNVALTNSKKRKMGKQGGKGAKKAKNQGKGESTHLKATAEEFGTLMDEHVGAKFDNIGMQAMANKDKADMKQLDWEMKRDLWVKGKDDKTKIKEKMGARLPHGVPGRGGGGGKRPSGQQGGNKRNRNQQRGKGGPKGKGKQKRKK